MLGQGVSRGEIVRFGLAAFLSVMGCKGEGDASSTPAASASAAITGPDTTTPEKALGAYYARMKSADFKGAMTLYSPRILRHVGVNVDTEIQARERDHFAGWRFVDHKITSRRELTPDVVLLNLWVKERTNDKAPETSDSSRVLVRDPDGWRISYAGLVDDRKLNGPALSRSGVSVQPTLVERFAEKTKLHFHVENGSRRNLHWGWPGRRSATVTFPDGTQQAIEGKNVQVQPGSKGDMWLQTNGFASTYPMTLVVQALCFGMGGIIKGELPDESSCWELKFDLGSAPAEVGGSK